jgi:hypothetical protein
MCQIGCALLPEQYAIFRPRSAGFIGYPAEWTVKPVAVAINNTTSAVTFHRTFFTDSLIILKITTAQIYWYFEFCAN